jgi:hypothetical protein
MNASADEKKDVHVAKCFKNTVGTGFLAFVSSYGIFVRIFVSSADFFFSDFEPK